MNIADILDEQGKENQNLVNKMKAYQDPLLKAFDEQAKNSSEEESSDDSSEEEQVSDIKFPKSNAQDLLQFIQRDLNNLANLEDN